MIAFYLSPTIGAGTESDPYRPIIDNYQRSWIANYDNTGGYSIVRVTAPNEVLSQLDSIAGVTPLKEQAEVKFEEM